MYSGWEHIYLLWREEEGVTAEVIPAPLCLTALRGTEPLSQGGGGTSNSTAEGLVTAAIEAGVLKTLRFVPTGFRALGKSCIAFIAPDVIEPVVEAKVLLMAGVSAIEWGPGWAAAEDTTPTLVPKEVLTAPVCSGDRMPGMLRLMLFNCCWFATDACKIFTWWVSWWIVSVCSFNCCCNSTFSDF